MIIFRISLKSEVFRVMSVRLWIRAVAAMMASGTLIE